MSYAPNYCASKHGIVGFTRSMTVSVVIIDNCATVDNVYIAEVPGTGQCACELCVSSSLIPIW